MCLMKDIISILEAIPNGEIVHLIFNDGTEIEVSDCEKVDESIYDKSDLVLADVIRKITGDKRFHTQGTKIEFQAQDIKRAISAKNGEILYE